MSVCMSIVQALFVICLMMSNAGRTPEQLQFVQFYQQIQVKIGNIWSSFVFAPAQELQLMLARCKDSLNVSDGFMWFHSFTIKTYTVFPFFGTAIYLSILLTVGCDTSTSHDSCEGLAFGHGIPGGWQYGRCPCHAKVLA